jgi:hypothetical protein
VPYVEDTSINVEMLFCIPIKTRAAEKEVFKIVDVFVKEKGVK